MKPTARPRRWSRRLALLAAIALLGIAPMLPVAAAAVIANANGCSLSEASASPCLMFGHDLGGALYTMGVLGWLTLVTLPVSALLFLAWLIWVLVTR